MSTDELVADEQPFVDRAYVLLDKGLADAEQSMASYEPQHRSTARAIQRALDILRQSRGTGQLVFGKMTADGETLYVGRRRVRDDERNAVVVGWHAPAAQPFYESSPSAAGHGHAEAGLPGGEPAPGSGHRGDQSRRS